MAVCHWLDITAQQRTHLRLTEPAVPAWRADAANPARCSPARDGLWINPEKGGDLSRSKQSLAAGLHVLPFLSSEAGTCPKCVGKRRFSPYVPENMHLPGRAARYE